MMEALEGKKVEEGLEGDPLTLIKKRNLTGYLLISGIDEGVDAALIALEGEAVSAELISDSGRSIGKDALSRINELQEPWIDLFEWDRASLDRVLGSNPKTKFELTKLDRKAMVQERRARRMAEMKKKSIDPKDAEETPSEDKKAQPVEKGRGLAGLFTKVSEQVKELEADKTQPEKPSEYEEPPEEEAPKPETIDVPETPSEDVKVQKEPEPKEEAPAPPKKTVKVKKKTVKTEPAKGEPSKKPVTKEPPSDPSPMQEPEPEPPKEPIRPPPPPPMKLTEIKREMPEPPTTIERPLPIAPVHQRPPEPEAMDGPIEPDVPSGGEQEDIGEKERPPADEGPEPEEPVEKPPSEEEVSQPRPPLLQRMAPEGPALPDGNVGKPLLSKPAEETGAPPTIEAPVYEEPPPVVQDPNVRSFEEAIIDGIDELRKLSHELDAVLEED